MSVGEINSPSGSGGVGIGWDLGPFARSAALVAVGETGVLGGVRLLAEANPLANLNRSRW